MKAMQKTLCALLVGSLLTGAVSASAEEQFSASATGIGTVTVTLTVDNSQITGAVVNTENETAGFGLEIGDTLAQQIMDAQSADIDGVSGATITSTAARSAAQMAMEAAGLTEVSNTTMTPGIYVGSAYGSKSTIKMAVEVDASSILNIWNLENGDTEILSDKAIEAVSDRIVTAQSLAVDALSGATITSHGVIAAVDDALTQAGANTSAWYRTEPKEKNIGITEDYDIVIVGAGTSGMTAALSAATDAAFSAMKSGLKVLVVERNGFAGGDLAVSGGYVAAMSGTPLNDALQLSVDADTVASVWKSNHENISDLINATVMDKVLEYGPNVMNGLMDRGLYMTINDATLGSIPAPNTEEGKMAYTMARIAHPVTHERSGDNGYDFTSGAPWLADSIVRMLEDEGIEIRYETSCTSLIVDDSHVCTGIMVEDHNSIYQINAKKVILCTGYSTFDEESVNLFYPDQRGTVDMRNGGNHADAPKWILELGGEPFIDESSNVLSFGYEGVLGLDGEESRLYGQMTTIWVDGNGKLVSDNSASDSQMAWAPHKTARSLLDLDKPGYAYMIFDANHEGVKYYDTLAAQHVAWKADTLNELANMIGVDTQSLSDTVSAYNEAAASAADDQSFAPATVAPFYAVKVSCVSPRANATVYVDDDMTVLLSHGGERIENLYAAGGAAGNNFSNSGLGTHVYTAFASGSYAADCARKAILGK